MSRRTKAERAERQDAIDRLRDWIKPGDTVYTILESVSRSGMSRTIRVVLPYIDGKHLESPHSQSNKPTDYVQRDSMRVDFLHPNHAIGLAIGARQAKRGDGLIIGGCGMDVGFHLVYELSSVLYGPLRCENPACKGPRYPTGEWRASLDALVERNPAIEGAYVCEHCQQSYAGGYRCLGKGKCPSNYHVNHRDRVRCPADCHKVWVYRDEPPPDLWQTRRETGVKATPAALDLPGWAHRIDDTDRLYFHPRRYLAVHFAEDGNTMDRVCETCDGVGDVPNPDGPERWDLLHTDGYAIRHRWL